jgi:hypothetical protein
MVSRGLTPNVEGRSVPHGRYHPLEVWTPDKAAPILGAESMRASRILSGIAVAVIATGCSGGLSDVTPGPVGFPVRVVESPTTPFDEVAAGPVRGIIPHRWTPASAERQGQAPEGFVASPRPGAWRRMDGTVAGMTAMWVDVSRVGVPSDFYYVAARSAAFDDLTANAACHSLARRVLVDHRPDFFDGASPGSPGDYVARGRGTCGRGSRQTRWASFVAAPGYGSVRRLGIPSSGLYLVLAVLPNSSRAPERLRAMLRGARFGGASLAELSRAAAREEPTSA